MTFFFTLKLLVIAFFLFMFWRGSKLVWGIGLLTVTSAVLLDTLFAVFGREALLDQLGFFYHVLGGLIFAGAAVWLVGLLRGTVFGAGPAETARASAQIAQPVQTAKRQPVAPTAGHDDAGPYDRQMLYAQIHQNFGPDDVLDLIFDLDINENDVMAPGYDMAQIILNVMDLAVERRQMSDLALAVERILTPVPPEHLPRLEKLSADSPPTVLRRYLLAHYFLSDVEEMAQALGVDWERLALGSKQNKIRSMLLYLKRRNRLGDLIALMQSREAHSQTPQ